MKKVGNDKKKRERSVEEIEEMFSSLNSVASYSEMTGLIPANPESKDSVKAYSEIYEIPVPNKPEEFKAPKEKM